MLLCTISRATLLLRRRVLSSSSVLPHQQRNTLVTSSQKRALNKAQLEGTKETAVEATKTAATNVAPSSAGGGVATAASAVEGGGAGGGLGLPLLVLVGGGGLGFYYFKDELMNMSTKGGDDKKKDQRRGDDDAIVVDGVKEIADGVKEIMQERKNKKKITKQKKEEEGTAGTSSAAPVAETALANEKHQEKQEQKEEEDVVVEEEIVSLEHPENGNRVDIDKINTFYETVNVAHAKQQQEEEEQQQNLLDAAQESATKATQYNESDESQTTIDPTVALTTAAAAMSELQSNQSLQNSKTLAAAQAALKSDLDREYFTDLDQLSPSELRVRVVQLATEMSDRTKWEAIRLKEFLAMKEKEVGDKYLEILQKQRLEFENLLAQKLREQEDVITRQANAALQAKEDSIANLLRATADAREKETQDILSNETRRITGELELEYTTKLQNELARMKQAYASDLEKHGSVMETLKSKLELLSSRLEVSRNYESGSKRAHRVSAAALALASKLEVGEGAAVELAALKGAAGGEGVIASAVKMIPTTAAKDGVPTVAELQATFDKSYTVGRQAVMVPEGRAGLEGQLLGMIFAKLSVPPSPDAVPTSDDEGNVADGVLSLARKYVQMGDLESALEQLNKLKGQAAYVMNDWRSQAADRVSTERALKVIKLECALLNKELVE